MFDWEQYYNRKLRNQVGIEVNRRKALQSMQPEQRWVPRDQHSSTNFLDLRTALSLIKPFDGENQGKLEAFLRACQSASR